MPLLAVGLAAPLALVAAGPRLAPMAALGPTPAWPPAAFADGELMTASPLPDTPGVRAEGKLLFAANCAECHGRNADGKGPVAEALDPPPADLRDVARRRSLAYLYWRMTHGKPPTAMPSFRGLPDHERWAMARFIDSLAQD